jgi:hypothetical protein
MSNGEQTENLNTGTKLNELAEVPSSFSSTNALVYSSNLNKDLNTNIIKQESVKNDKIIHDTYTKY